MGFIFYNFVDLWNVKLVGKISIILIESCF